MDRRETTQAVVETINSRDFEAVAELPWHPGLEFHSVVGGSEGDVYHGLQGLRQWAATVDETWEGFHLELLDFHEVDDDRAVVVLRLTGRARSSGAPLDARVGQVWTWRNGRLWRNVAYSDVRQALEAAGLAE